MLGLLFFKWAKPNNNPTKCRLTWSLKKKRWLIHSSKYFILSLYCQVQVFIYESKIFHARLFERAFAPTSLLVISINLWKLKGQQFETEGVCVQDECKRVVNVEYSIDMIDFHTILFWFSGDFAPTLNFNCVLLFFWFFPFWPHVFISQRNVQIRKTINLRGSHIE
jgi:hypothetical protein